MEALIIIDAQNEFSVDGKRPVPDFEQVITVIGQHVSHFRAAGKPIAWVRHFNKPHESPAFVPGTWGAAFYPGFGPAGEPVGPAGEPVGPQIAPEAEFQKNVYGAFAGSDIGSWLAEHKVDEVLITGFYTHGCVSTTAREAIMRELKVVLDINATGTCAIDHEWLGKLSVEEVKESALLQLYNMGASLKRTILPQRSPEAL
jgi:nicotinamidase-related amidase